MNRFRTSWLLLSGAAIAVTLGALRGSAGGAAPQRWEYAELSVVGNAVKGTWSLERPTGKVEGDSYRAVAKKAGLTVQDDSSTSVLNALGSQGWELATHSLSLTFEPLGGGGNPIAQYCWTFRRRK